MSRIRSGIEILRSGRSLAFVAGMKKTNDHADPTNVEHLKKQKVLLSLSLSGYSRKSHTVIVMSLRIKALIRAQQSPYWYQPL